MAVGRPWQKGQSGNPGGRPKSVERLVRELVGDDLPALIRAQIKIAQGLPPECAPELEVKAADATRAFDALLDRGWGKVKQQQQIEITSENVGRMEALTEAQLEALAALDLSVDDDDAVDPATH
jgi:hypothetical protein